MAKKKEVTINGQKFTLQSVSPSWYYELNDRCNMTGTGRHKSTEYMDELFKNCVVLPAEVRNGGMSYFDEQDDLGTAEKLSSTIESFLRGREQSGSSPA